MNIHFSAMAIASNPRGKVVIANKVATGQPLSYSDWEIRKYPTAVLKNNSGQIIDVVSIYKEGSQWMTDELAVSGLQG